MKKAVIYARCSTDEARQDTENQLQELRQYCAAFGWQCDEVSEYDSGFKGTQPKLQEILERYKISDDVQKYTELYGSNWLRLSPEQCLELGIVDSIRKEEK